MPLHILKQYVLRRDLWFWAYVRWQCLKWQRTILPVKTEKKEVLMRKYQKFKKTSKNFNRLTVTSKQSPLSHSVYYPLLWSTLVLLSLHLTTTKEQNINHKEGKKSNVKKKTKGRKLLATHPAFGKVCSSPTRNVAEMALPSLTKFTLKWTFVACHHGLTCASLRAGRGGGCAKNPPAALPSSLDRASTLIVPMTNLRTTRTLNAPTVSKN